MQQYTWYNELVSKVVNSSPHFGPCS